MYNYSFIIPHKNSPGLLQRCLDSIPSYDDIQVIIVDDNSDENKVDFSCFPGLDRDNTVCIFNKEGKGAGHARNLALKKATGKWLVFADADDYFAPSFKDILEKYREDDDTDMVFFNYCKVTSSGAMITLPITRHISNYNKGRMFSEKVLRYSAWSPWSRMVKRELSESNNILFEELPFSNDMMFVLRNTALAANIRAENIMAYYYYCPSTGTQTSVHYYNPHNIRLRMEGTLKLWNFYKGVGYPFIRPVWMSERDLGIKADKNLRKQYGFRCFYNFRDTINYLIAKIFKIL